MADPFDFELSGGIGTITLRRPKTLNSLTFHIYRELVRFFDEAKREDRLKVVILTGEALRRDPGAFQHLVATEPLHAGDFNLTDLKVTSLRKIVVGKYKCPAGRHQRQCSHNHPGGIYDPVTDQRPAGLPVFPESVFSGWFRFQRLVPLLCFVSSDLSPQPSVLRPPPAAPATFLPHDTHLRHPG